MIYSQMGVDNGMNTFKSLPETSETVVPPPVRSKHFVSQRHEVNPALAFNLLKDIHSVVSIWHEQLRQIVDALHALHAQGPMVDGWLESSVERSHSVAEAGVDSSILRHGDIDVLLRYVDAMEKTTTHSPSAGDSNLDKTHSDSPAQVTRLEKSSEAGRKDEAGREKATTTYRLCHMDESGQVISQHCPPEQMGMVSMAIARYHKFRQLMSQKQAIEAKLQRTVDELTGTRSALGNS